MQITLENIKTVSREIIIVSVLVISLMIAIFIIKWGQEPDYRPLVQDLRLADAVKIADVLEQNNIRYFADIKSHMLYIDLSQVIPAKIALAKTGIVIDYPNIKVTENINESFSRLEEQFNLRQQNTEYYQQEWFQPFVKTISSMFIMIILILTLVRPALRRLLYPGSDNDQHNDEKS